MIKFNHMYPPACGCMYTEKTILPIPFTSNGIRSINHGDSFRFDFEPNGIPFGSKSKANLSSRSNPIQCERNWKYSFLSGINAT